MCIAARKGHSVVSVSRREHVVPLPPGGSFVAERFTKTTIRDPSLSVDERDCVQTQVAQIAVRFEGSGPVFIDVALDVPTAPAAVERSGTLLLRRGGQVVRLPR